ncbi:MAG: MATE family efflux transporter [Lachnospiraceae bacterium]|nr:MATE family efflux transporter [Lachnospiraceae bacterium]
MAKTELIKDYTTGSIPKSLWKFALPFMLSNALQVVYSLVDMIVVGQYVGSFGLSGVTVGSSIVMFMTMIGLGFSNGGQIYIAQLIGAGRKKELNNAIGTLFTLILGMAVVLTAIGLFIGHPVLKLINTPAESYDYAWDYFLVCTVGNVFTFGYNMVSAVLRGMGDSKRPFIFVLIASVINLVLDILFIGLLQMGTFGAALATVIGQAFAFIYALIYLFRRKEAFGFDFKLKSFAIDKASAKHLCRLGIPLAIQSGAINLSMIYVNSLVNPISVYASATFGTGVKIDDVVNRITYGLAMAGSSMIGQNVAADKPERASAVVRWIWIYSTIFYAIFTIVMLCAPQFVFRIFTKDKPVIELAPVFVSAVVWSFPGMLLMRGTNALMNGIGNSPLNLVFGLLDGVVLRICLSYLFGIVLDMGLYGFFLGYGLAAYGTSIPGTIYYLSGKWKSYRMLKKGA